MAWTRQTPERLRRTVPVLVAGAGVVLFEAVEVALVGPHPLQVVLAGVGGAVVVLAVRARDAPRPVPVGAPSGPGSSW